MTGPRTGATSRALAQVGFLAGIAVPAVAVSVVTEAQLGTASASASPLLVAGLAVAFFTARLLAIRFPQGDEACVVLMVGLAALGVMEIRAILLVCVLSGVLDALVRYSQSPHPGSIARAQDAVRSAAVLGLLSPWQLIVRPLLMRSDSGDVLLAVAFAAGVTYALVDSFTLAIQQRLQGGHAVGHGMFSLLNSLIPVYLVHIAMGAVVLRVYPALGLWALAIGVLLTLILQNSVSLYMRIRRAYDDTIGALAHAAELDNPRDTGHSRRVADMSISVAREFGMSGNALGRVRYAALLHDIGRIGHIDVGVPRQHSQRGAEIVASIPFLADVAPLIGHQDDLQVQEDMIGAAIVGVCSRYDRLRERHGSRIALDILLADEQDGRREVVVALRKVAISQGVETSS